MELVRARSNKNKLGVFDNRPFAVDMRLVNKILKASFLDLRTGERD